MIGKTIEEIKLGDKAEFSKTISESDVYLFAGITGDFNPAHINATKVYPIMSLACILIPAATTGRKVSVQNG